MTLILDGTKASAAIADTLKKRIRDLAQRPCLAVIQIGDRRESTTYIARKRDFGERIGAEVRHLVLPESVTEAEVLARIEECNRDAAVHGILLQLPIPHGLPLQKLLNAIVLAKDVDGLAAGSTFVPATARGIAELLQFYRIPIRGKKIAMLGRSALVGAPTARLLSHLGGVVTVCHSETPNTREVTRASEIIVVAIGKPRQIDATYFTAGAGQTVVDVGITSQETLVGDVNFEAVKDMVVAISPVPGGVGPMTVAALFENLLDAYGRQRVL